MKKLILKKQIGNHGAFFRPSGTQYSNATIRKGALAAGYGKCISYDVDSHDYEDVGKAAVIKNVMTSIKGGSIVIFNNSILCILSKILYSFFLFNNYLTHKFLILN